MSMFEAFTHLFGSPEMPPEADVGRDGMDSEHLAYRQAVERCEGFRPAVEANQMTVSDVVDRLRANAVAPEVIRKAIAESFGDEAAERYAG